MDRVDTHSLISGGENSLSLAGYSNRDIQKMVRWRGGTFKEYIREEFHCFSEVMLTAMKQDFKFFNIAGGAYSKLVDVTRTTVVSYYQPATEENKNEYNSTVTKLWGGDSVDRWLKKPRKVQDDIVFE